MVEGSNSVTLDGCILTSTNANETRGIFLYNSESGDASAGTSYLTMTGGTYNYNTSTGPAIQITNTTAVIALTNVTISNSSSELLAAVVVSTWGTSGSNGGHVTLTASEQTLSGTVVVDSISSAALTLKNSSTLTSTINSADTAESVTLTLDSTSKWTVSGTSYLTKLAGVVLSSTTATNIVGSTSAPIVHATAATDSSGNSLSGTYSLSGRGSLVVGS